MSDEAAHASATQAIRVWDLPTRIFHWLLAALVVLSFVSAWIGGGTMAWHMRFGYGTFTLLLFRLAWGVVGGRWSRFANFVHGPRAALRYLRNASRPDERHHVGHNPLGAWSVLALLTVLAIQVGTGLVADDEVSFNGPLLKFVSSATSSLATHWHRNVGQWLVLSLVVLHVGAIAFYWTRRRQDLVAPMLHGDKMLTLDVPPSIDTLGSRAMALAIAAFCAIAVAAVVRLGG